MPLPISSTALRGAFALLASAAILTGVSACSPGAEEPEPSDSSSESEESTAPEETADESEAPADDASGTLCTEQQLTTLFAATGQEVPEGTFSTATATFEPAEALGDLPAECIATISIEGVGGASVAVLPGGAETTSALEENLTAAGATPTAAEDTLVATVGDTTVAAQPFTTITSETEGFENPDDLIVVVASAAAA